LLCCMYAHARFLCAWRAGEKHIYYIIVVGSNNE
jgi:hypothetical protein